MQKLESKISKICFYRIFKIFYSKKDYIFF